MRSYRCAIVCSDRLFVLRARYDELIARHRDVAPSPAYVMLRVCTCVNSGSSVCWCRLCVCAAAGRAIDSRRFTASKEQRCSALNCSPPSLAALFLSNTLRIQSTTNNMSSAEVSRTHDNADKSVVFKGLGAYVSSAAEQR